MIRVQQLHRTVGNARRARGLTQAELAGKSGLSRTTINQLENGVCLDIGLNKMQNVLRFLGLELHVRPAQRSRRPNYVRMACAAASAGYREHLTESELLRALATGRIPSGRRPHLRMLLREAPIPLLKGLLVDVGAFAQPPRIAQNLCGIAERLGGFRRVQAWLRRA